LRTATFFGLGLFPRNFLIHRVYHADVVILLSDKSLNYDTCANRCVMRTATGILRPIMFPVTNKDFISQDGEKTEVAIDDALVQDPMRWSFQFLREVRRGYTGLKRVQEIEAMLKAALMKVNSPWLVDYLMGMMVATMNHLGLEKKTYVRGSDMHRRRYPNDDEYLLDICLEYDCQKIILGHSQMVQLNQKQFTKNGIQIFTQKWDGSDAVKPMDCILDTMARIPNEEILATLK
jgi:WbqC-like protein family